MGAPGGVAADASLSAGDTPEASHDDLLLRVGHMTRSLHENLLALGLDGLVERVANQVPDARDRLDYVARMTEQAAQRVLDATDAALPLQQSIETGAAGMAAEWRAAAAGPFSEQQFRTLAERSATYLGQTRNEATQTREHLMAIMMAQDFQDLTGQVIKKVTLLAHELEQQLVQLLVDYTPPDMRRDGPADSGLLNGPQIKPAGKADVVADQSQVDDLLDSLGF